MITRTVSGLYGGRRAGSFAGKYTSLHPVGKITRPVSGLYGARRAGSFASKTFTDQVALDNYIIRARRLARR